MKEMLTVVGGIFPGRSWLGGSGRAYCEADVDITRRLYEFGRAEGHVLFTSRAGQRVRIPVEW